MNETMVTVVGNIASELTLRRVGAEEHAMVGFRVASSERRWDKVSGAWVDGDRFSAWVTCWRRLGEHVRDSLVKGDPVVVWGRLSVREYETVNGERRYSTDITATAVGPDLTRSTAHVTRQRLSAVEPERSEPDAAADGAPDIVPEATPETSPDAAPAAASPGDAGTDAGAGATDDTTAGPGRTGSRPRKERPVTAVPEGPGDGPAEQGADGPRPLPATA